MAKELTLEEQIAALTAENAELTAKVAELETALEKAAAVNSVFTKEVPGTYKQKGGRVFKFKTGFMQTRNTHGEVVASVELLKNAEEMDRLIEIGYGGIEEVNK